MGDFFVEGRKKSHLPRGPAMLRANTSATIICIAGISPFWKESKNFDDWVKLTMWIAGSTIGLRKTMLLSVIGVFFCYLLSPFPFLFYCSVGLLTGSLITIAYFVYSYGIFVRLYSWTDCGDSHEVRQYINFINPKKNYRCICEKGNSDIKFWTSGIYTTHHTEWAYFDIVRQILNANKRKLPQKILVLGGGGGALPCCISELYPTTEIETVEISKQMIHVAKRYFCRTSNHQKNKWVHQDAFTHVRQSAKARHSYNCVIVDLFEHIIIPKFIYNTSFIRPLHRILESDGLLFMNFGWQNIDSKRLRSLYAATFNNFRLYHYQGGVIGTNWSLPHNTSAISLN